MHSPFACCSKYTQNFDFRYHKKHLHVVHFFDTTAFPYDFPFSGSPTRRFSKCSEKYKKPLISYEISS